MFSHSIRSRWLLSMAVVLVFGFCALAINLYETRDQLRRSIMLITAHEIGAGLDSRSDFTKLPSHHAGSELFYTLYASNGDLLWHSSNLENPRRLRRGTLEDEIRLIRTTVRSGRGEIINVPVTLTDGSILMVSKNDHLERELIDNLLHQRIVRALALLIPFGLIVIGLLFVLLRWTLLPIKKAVGLAENIGPDQPDLRIPLNELPGEVRPLARVANEGLDRLAQAYKYEQSIVNDAAHALRTPLAVLGLHLQKLNISDEKGTADLIREFEKVHKLVNQLLVLAHQDRLQLLTLQGDQHADLARMTREAAGTMLPLFEVANRSIEVSLNESVTVRGNAELLREAIRNVLENALYHGAGNVTMTMGAPVGEIVTLDIKDEGTGVPPEEQEEMFLRFRKGRENSAGSGLGLAIVRSTLRNTGGDASFIKAMPGTVQLRFRIANSIYHS